ncbi:hypothetical protein BZB76_5437 [Actinomadura pelletieri DSM 43383]|uniref:Guanylate cyclase domain-containing protein n=1 Tax=Actinomadura pelletieri DSM 43383 TaxID=1120940 RepID=A0A495QGC1_9ACTN|nr:hypothetical protein [Actinomadura pelletieri]RKS70957.1 hypothetical protein BZB76_5437 [Actinomadura pelletieri DSM 43383]
MIENRTEAKPRHRLLAANDIPGFSRRDEAAKIVLRQALYRITKNACEAAGVPWRTIRHEDRGDGILMVLNSAGLETLLTPLLQETLTGIRLHNRCVIDPQHELQLRMALTDGYVHQDPYGVSGKAVNLLFRLLEADTFKRQLEESSADFGLIISDSVYQTATGYRLIDSKDFTATCVDVKETHTNAWTYIPSGS